MTDAFDYLESRDDADEMIAEFGQAISLRRTATSGPAYDPTLTTTDYATKAAKIEFSRKQIATGAVLDTDERWLVAAGPLTALGVSAPARPDAILTTDGVVHPLLRCDPISPAGVSVLYDCWIRF